MANTSPKDLPFNAVFPDTNIFLPRWPYEAAGLADLVSTTGLFDIPIYLLEAVEIELEAHQMRESRATAQKISKLAHSLPQLISLPVHFESPNWETVRSELRAKVAETKAALGLRSCAFSSLHLQDLFSMATNQEPPFGDEGKNFQDAVIIRSVIEASRRENLSRVAFVSRNYKDFDLGALARRGRENGITLSIYTSLDAVHEALWPHVQDVIRTAWTKDNQLAEVAIASARHALEAFLRETFVRTTDVTLELLGITSVQTAYWDRITKQQSPTAVRVVVDVRFVTTFAADLSRGQELKSFEIDRGITVEGWVTFADGAYRDVQFESAALTR